MPHYLAARQRVAPCAPGPVAPVEAGRGRLRPVVEARPLCPVPAGHRLPVVELLGVDVPEQDTVSPVAKVEWEQMRVDPVRQVELALRRKVAPYLRADVPPFK